MSNRLYQRIVISLALILALLMNGYGNPDEMKLSDAEVIKRIDFIEKRLTANQESSRVWYGLWLGVYTTAATSYGYIYYRNSHDNIDSLVTAIKSSIGVIASVAMPFKPAFAASAFQRLAGSTPEERAQKLFEGERLLRLCAQSSEMGKSWIRHTASFLVNAIGFIVIWRLQSWVDGLINFAIGFAAAEVAIWSQPGKAVQDYSDYRRLFHGDTATRTVPSMRKWFITVTRNGIGLGYFYN